MARSLLRHSLLLSAWGLVAGALQGGEPTFANAERRSAPSQPAAKASLALSRELGQALGRRFARTPSERCREADILLKLHAKVIADNSLADNSLAESGLSTTERDCWLARLKGRLSRLAGDIRRDVAAGRGGAAQDDGQSLVELIETTIAPQTWDVNGGQGTIRYWPAWHVLVVRQTEDVHEQIGGVVRGMRH